MTDINFNTNNKNGHRGFTLIELIVVIAIIGVLAAILIPQLNKFTSNAEKKAALSEARSVVTAIVTLKSEGKISATKNEIASISGITVDRITSADIANLTLLYTAPIQNGGWTVTYDKGTWAGTAMN